MTALKHLFFTARNVSDSDINCLAPVARSVVPNQRPKIIGPEYWRYLAEWSEHRTVNVTVALLVLSNEYPYAPKLNEKVQLTHKEHPRDVKRRSAANNQKINSENIKILNTKDIIYLRDHSSGPQSSERYSWTFSQQVRCPPTHW